MYCRLVEITWICCDDETMQIQCTYYVVFDDLFECARPQLTLKYQVIMGEGLGFSEESPKYLLRVRRRDRKSLV